MKLIFEINGDEFEIQAGEFDSLLQIKAKVEEMQGIPIAKQIMTVNGNTLIDDFDLVCHEIEDGSRIHLDIAGEPPQVITISVNLPKPLYTMNLQVNAHGTILQLKEAIQAMAKIPIHRIMVRNKDGVELLDGMKLQEIESITESKVMVEYLPSSSHPPSPTTPTPPTSSSQPPAAPKPPPVKIRVELHHGDKRMNVYASEDLKLQVLKTKLVTTMKMPEEYYFAHERPRYVILKEELTFKEQNVVAGDVIQIFPAPPRKK